MQPPPRDNVGIANRAAAELDHMSPLTASPAFEKTALRGILHALLALVDAQAPAPAESEFPAPNDAEVWAALGQAKPRPVAPRTRKPRQEASK